MIERIHNYLKQRYEGYETVSVPPFTIYFASTADALLNSVAIPDHRIQDDVSDALALVCEQFDKRGLLPRIQYMDVYNPLLTRMLDENGFTCCLQQEIMVCTPDSYRPVPTMPGLSTIILSHDSDLDTVKQGMVTHQLGFAARDTQLMNTAPDMFRQSLVSSRAFVLRLDGEPVTTGMFTAIREGVTELTGISTVPAFRRRGFGAYLTGNMMQVAFSRQANLVFMAVLEEKEASVYKRVGFESKAMLLTYEMER